MTIRALHLLTHLILPTTPWVEDNSILQMENLRHREVNNLSKVIPSKRYRLDVNADNLIWELSSQTHEPHCLSVSLNIFLKYLFIYCYSESMDCLILFNYLDNHAVFGNHYADNEFSLYNSIMLERKYGILNTLIFVINFQLYHVGWQDMK